MRRLLPISPIADGETHYDLTPYRPETHHRHFFLLTLDEPTPQRWVSEETDADDGSGPKRFECYWIPLTQGHVLSAGQGALLGRLPDARRGGCPS